MSEIKEGNLAEIKDLSVSFMTDAGSIKAIDKISFEIPRKKVIGVVGESGSGKSVTARSLIKLLPETATTSGAVYLSNRAGTGSWKCCRCPANSCAKCAAPKRPWCSRAQFGAQPGVYHPDGRSRKAFAPMA
ncbi:MAG: ATP-binding cassette domain-containing protein [Bifidobacterium adolescentis]